MWERVPTPKSVWERRSLPTTPQDAREPERNVGKYTSRVVNNKGNVFADQFLKIQESGFRKEL